MYKQVIGEKRAKEIVKQMIQTAQENNISLPKCHIYLEKVGVHGLLEAYTEIRQYVNVSGGFSFPYEDSVRLTEYVRSVALTKEQFTLIENPQGIVNVHLVSQLIQFSKKFFS